MKIKLVFIFLLCLSLYHSQTADQWIESYRQKKTYKLGGLDIQGVENNDRSVIQLLTGLIVGEDLTIPGQQIQYAIKKLWKQGLFETIAFEVNRIENNQVYLTLRVTEKPRLSKFAFKGEVRRGEAEDLRGRLKLSEGRVLTDYVLGQISASVLEFYKDKGFTQKIGRAHV